MFQQQIEISVGTLLVGSLFNDDFSVTRLHIVDDRISE
jgi:hypothetical protein